MQSYQSVPPLPCVKTVCVNTFFHRVWFFTWCLSQDALAQLLSLFCLKTPHIGYCQVRLAFRWDRGPELRNPGPQICHSYNLLLPYHHRIIPVFKIIVLHYLSGHEFSCSYHSYRCRFSPRKGLLFQFILVLFILHNWLVISIL